jgi:hypothetical protein
METPQPHRVRQPQSTPARACTRDAPPTTHAEQHQGTPVRRARQLPLLEGHVCQECSPAAQDVIT